MLQEIHIEGFRGIKDLRLSFLGADGKPSKLVVLGGPNGSGKTAVLEAVLLAAGNRDLARGQFGKGAIHAGCNDYKITAIFAGKTGPYTVEYSAATSPKPFKVDCDYFSSWRAPKLVGALGITAGKKGNRPLRNEENRIWNIKQYLINARAYQTMSTPDSPIDGSQYSEVINRVNDVWKMFYPSSNQSFSVDPAGQDPSDGFDVFLNLSDNIKVPLDALSSGQVEIFALAGSMLPDTYPVSLICIDE
ncbi:MAG: hypothetical protein EHM48_01665, partial [Planctomycetaceae bacterium]